MKRLKQSKKLLTMKIIFDAKPETLNKLNRNTNKNFVLNLKQ